MMASAQALIAKFGEAVRQNVESNVTDLLFRFQNRALKDTVARVGADPVRKLRRNDRIVGAALFAMEQGVEYVLEHYMGLSTDEPLYRAIETAYREP